MVYTVVWLGLALYAAGRLRFFTRSGVRPWALRGLFAAKVAAGAALLWLYTFHYPTTTADIHLYFHDGLVLHSSLAQSPADFLSMLTGLGADDPRLMRYYDAMELWIKPIEYNLHNDNRTVIRLNALFRLVSGGEIMAHVVLFNFLSFFGLIGLFRFLSPMLTPSRRGWALLLVALLPTVLCWGSGMLKESVLLFGFGMFAWFVGSFLGRPLRWKYLPWAILAALFLLRIKFYVLISFIPALLWLVAVRFWPRRRAMAFVATHALLAAAALALGRLVPQYDPLMLLACKQHDFINMITLLTPAGSAIPLSPLDGTLWSLLRAAPGAVANTLLRPHLLEWHNTLALAAALENTLLALLAVGAVALSGRAQWRRTVVWIGLSFTLILSVTVGVATPVLGALIRYRMMALPLLAAALAELPDSHRATALARRLHAGKAAELAARGNRWLNKTLLISDIKPRPNP